MGADFRWMMCAIDDATLEKVAPLFASPAGVQLDGDQRHVYERFRDAPETLLPRRMVSGDGEIRIEANGSSVEIAAGNKNGPWTGVTYQEGAFFIAEGGELEGGRILRIAADVGQYRQ